MRNARKIFINILTSSVVTKGYGTDLHLQHIKKVISFNYHEQSSQLWESHARVTSLILSRPFVLCVLYNGMATSTCSESLGNLLKVSVVENKANKTAGWLHLQLTFTMVFNQFCHLISLVMHPLCVFAWAIFSFRSAINFSKILVS